MNVNAVRWHRPRIRGPRRCAAALLVAGALGGCGSAARSATGHDPVRSADGVRLPGDATRIVSLSGAATEDLFAVGSGRQVIAADEYSDYPRDAPRTRLSGFSPNVEAIARYRPDLVVISQNVDHVEAQLAALHIPVLYEPAPADLAGAEAQIRALGAVSGHAARAAALVARLRARVAAIVASVPRRRTLSVYHELDQNHFSASSHTFIGQLYRLLGLRNIADRAGTTTPYPQLSSEYVIARDPDLIVLADTVCCGQSVRTLAARPGWGRIAAVRDHAVLAVNDSVASEWGPRIVSFLATVAAEVRRLQERR